MNDSKVIKRIERLEARIGALEEKLAAQEIAAFGLLEKRVNKRIDIEVEEETIPPLSFRTERITS